MSADELRQAAETLRAPEWSERMPPAFAHLIARWMDAEGQVLEMLDPWTELLNAVIEDRTGEKAVMRLLRDESGQPKIIGDCTPSALALARLINGGAA